MGQVRVSSGLKKNYGFHSQHVSADTSAGCEVLVKCDVVESLYANKRIVLMAFENR